MFKWIKKLFKKTSKVSESLGFPSYTTFGGYDIIIVIDSVEQCSIQNVSWEWDNKTKMTRGRMVNVVFNQSLHLGIEQPRDLMDIPFNIVITGSSEYGDAMCMALTNVVITKWSSGTTVDDIIINESFQFESADRPNGWRSVPFKSPYDKPEAK